MCSVDIRRTPSVFSSSFDIHHTPGVFSWYILPTTGVYNSYTSYTYCIELIYSLRLVCLVDINPNLVCSVDIHPVFSWYIFSTTSVFGWNTSYTLCFELIYILHLVCSVDIHPNLVCSFDIHRTPSVFNRAVSVYCNRKINTIFVWIFPGPAVVFIYLVTKNTIPPPSFPLILVCLL